MGVGDNHTKYEPETQRWRRGTGVASAGPPFQNLQFRAKIGLFFWPKTALEPVENNQMKGNSGYSTHAEYVCEPPPKGPKKPQNLCTLAADGPKPKTDHILSYVAQKAISSAPNPPASTHFWWFPPLKIAPTDA